MSLVEDHTLPSPADVSSTEIQLGVRRFATSEGEIIRQCIEDDGKVLRSFLRIE
jgi:hypothetical protein